MHWRRRSLQPGRQPWSTRPNSYQHTQMTPQGPTMQQQARELLQGQQCQQGRWLGLSSSCSSRSHS